MTAIPELAENFIRKWAVISSHNTEDGGSEVVTFATVLDEETNELVVSGINKFSDFYAVYDDEELVDFSELIESIIEAEDKEEEKYTEESWANLQEKLAEVRELMLKAEGQTKLAMQNEIDAAKEELNAAIEGLVEVAAPDTGANFITSSPAVISAVTFAATGSILALVALAIKRKMTRR